MTTLFCRGVGGLSIDNKTRMPECWGLKLITLDGKQLDANFMEKLIKIRSILNSWSVRRLILLGKITIIRSQPSQPLKEGYNGISTMPSHDDIFQNVFLNESGAPNDGFLSDPLKRS